MKASEVLRKYRAGHREFQGVNLRGQSFKGQDLSGADFSEADIRSTNFTDATLIGANFSGAKCGLQRHWATFLVILSWLLAGISGYVSILPAALISLIFYYPNKIPGFISLIVVSLFLIISIIQGIGSASVVVAFVFAFVMAVVIIVPGGREVGSSFLLPGIGVVAGPVLGTVAVAILETRAVKRLVPIVGIGAVTGAFASLGIGVLTETFSNLERGDFVIAATGAVAVVLISLFLARRALRGDERDAWVRFFAIAFAATGGTNFQDANLTDANFTGARLKSTDLRKATLTRVRWYGAKMLDRVRPGDTYLKNEPLRELLITGKGQNQNFDHQDLRGVNVQGANLTNTSFIDTDLSQANLQESNLFEAKLVQTNLDQTNLSNTHLTGAYIEDWGITRRTKLEGVKCKYVYLKLPTEGDRDPNRMPPSEQGEFGENDFNIFITSVLDTLDLYHKDNINAGLAITILKGLTEDYPVQFELVGLEKRGDNQFVIRLKVFGQTSHFQIQREYYARYEQTLPLYDPKKLMPDTDNVVAEIIKTVEENSGTHIENLHNQGIVITGGKVDMSGDRKINAETYYEQSGSNIGISHMSGGEIKDNAKVVGKMNIYASEQKQTLAEAAAEIQKLLKQLRQTNPDATEDDKIAYVNDETTPSFKRKAAAALKAAGETAIDEFFDNPYVKVGKAAIMAWIQP